MWVEDKVLCLSNDEPCFVRIFTPGLFLHRFYSPWYYPITFSPFSQLAHQAAILTQDASQILRSFSFSISIPFWHILQSISVFLSHAITLLFPIFTLRFCIQAHSLTSTNAPQFTLKNTASSPNNNDDTALTIPSCWNDAPPPNNLAYTSLRKLSRC